LRSTSSPAPGRVWGCGCGRYYICPARRCRGLGRPTVDHVIRLALENSARLIHAAVEPTNLPSLAILRAAAFTESGPNEYGETDFELVLDA
jgi:L-amino acid N-acyltransferase YncA